MNILDIAIAKKLAGGGGGSGTDNYNDLSNLPKINDTTLSGNKSSSALGLQSEINSDSKLASDLVDDTNQDNKFVTSTEKNTWNAKQNAIDSDHKLSSDLVDDANKTNKFVTSTEKNTWNAKQNALTFDDTPTQNSNNPVKSGGIYTALTGKQASLDSTQLAAVNSGIDSSKVGQISTNQTNILYVAENGVKNVFPVASGTTSHSDGTLFDKIALHLIAGSWDFSWTSTATPTAGTIVAYDSNKTEITRIAVPSGSTSFSGTLTLSQDAYYVTLYVGIDTTVSNIMCKPSWMNNDYQPPALPNYDLTRLEAEDRASLAEEIDAGAKNKLDCNVSTLTPLNTYGSWSGSTYSINSGTTSFVVNSNLTITASKSDTGTARSMTFANYVDGSVLNGMVISGGTSNVTIIVQKNGGNYETYATSEGDGALISGIAANTAVRIVASIASAVTCSNVVIKPMLCTKAAFGVSSKFVPYRPNWDLVSASVPQTSYVVNHNVTTSNVYELVNNLYVDVPTGKRVFIAVGAKKSNPIGIALCDNNTYAENRVIIQNEVANAQGMVSATGIYDNGDVSGTTRLYVFMKSQTSMAIQSRITLSWWYI